MGEAQRCNHRAQGSRGVSGTDAGGAVLGLLTRSPPRQALVDGTPKQVWTPDVLRALSDTMQAQVHGMPRGWHRSRGAADAVHGR